jgi:hypothetical protein
MSLILSIVARASIIPARGTVYFAYTQPTPRRQLALRRDAWIVIRADISATRLVNTVRRLAVVSALRAE